jgi:hypothetical protein
MEREKVGRSKYTTLNDLVCLILLRIHLLMLYPVKERGSEGDQSASV